jgi:dTDP-4-dehydrorhamnose reductase
MSRMFADLRPELVLHLAAETDLEYCETHADVARDTNALALRTVSQLCTRYGSTLIYISTAGVFDGRKEGFYTEADEPNPIMIYGRTKFEGEQEVRRHCDRAFVVRAGWMMGGGRTKEKKFVYKILQQIAQDRAEIFAVNDRWGTPTYTHDFAMNLFSLIDTRRYGTYHMVCEGMGTRFDVAREILRICRRDDIRLTAVGSDHFKEEYFVERPRSEMLINEQLSTIGLNRMSPWRAALRAYLENYFYDYIGTNGTGRRERRKHRRTQDGAGVPVSLVDGGERRYAGFLLEQSVAGAAVMCAQPPPAGHTVTLSGSRAGGSHEPLDRARAYPFRVGLESVDVDRYVVAYAAAPAVGAMRAS